MDNGTYFGTFTEETLPIRFANTDYDYPIDITPEEAELCVLHDRYMVSGIPSVYNYSKNLHYRKLIQSRFFESYEEAKKLLDNQPSRKTNMNASNSPDSSSSSTGFS